MRVNPTDLSGVLLIEPDVFPDNRGYFLEAFQADRYADLSVDGPFVQDNLSRSMRGALRGLHYQLERPQAKLVTVVSGSVFDVVVDLRRGSDTFLKWVGVELSDTNHHQLYIPAGFAHGFQVLSGRADFHYKCTDYYDASSERGILWNDPRLAIDWPVAGAIVSEKDQKNSRIDEIEAAHFFE